MRSFKQHKPEKREENSTRDKDERRLLSVRESVAKLLPMQQRRARTPRPIKDANDVLDVVKRELASSEVEVFVILHLDTKHRLKSVQVVSYGTLTECLVHPREVFCEAVRQRSQAIIACHNHPSGDPEPSRQDIDLTTRLYRAGELLGIPLLDHVIVGRDRQYLSLAAIGFISSSAKSTADSTCCSSNPRHSYGRAGSRDEEGGK